MRGPLLGLGGLVAGGFKSEVLLVQGAPGGAPLQDTKLFETIQGLTAETSRISASGRGLAADGHEVRIAVSATNAEHHAETFTTLQEMNLNVGHAWAIKEALRTLWTFQTMAQLGRQIAARAGQARSALC